MGVMGDDGGGERMGIVCCLLMTPKSSVGIRFHSVEFRQHSFRVIPGTISSIWQAPLPNLIPPEFWELPGFRWIPAGISGGQ